MYSLKIRCINFEKEYEIDKCKELLKYSDYNFHIGKCEMNMFKCPHASCNINLNKGKMD